MMRITVEIDDLQLRQIQEATGETNKSSAVRKAAQSFLHERRKHALLEKVRTGQTDFGLTNDELEAKFEDDMYRSHPRGSRLRDAVGATGMKRAWTP